VSLYCSPRKLLTRCQKYIDPLERRRGGLQSADARQCLVVQAGREEDHARPNALSAARTAADAWRRVTGESDKLTMTMRVE
jgi:hypothetical protein